MRREFLQQESMAYCGLCIFIFLLNPESSIPIHPIYPRGYLGWIGMDVFHIRE